MVRTSILVKIGLKNVSHTFTYPSDGDNALCMTSQVTRHPSPTEHGSPQGRKVGPPPLKTGAQYINPGDEDQMVRFDTSVKNH